VVSDCASLKVGGSAVCVIERELACGLDFSARRCRRQVRNGGQPCVREDVWASSTDHYSPV
jgi:hypothetical protein